MDTKNGLQIKSVAINLKDIGRKVQILEWGKKFEDRLSTHLENGIEYLIICDVTYDEFVELLSEYQRSAINKMYVVHSNKKMGSKLVDVMIGSVI